MKLIKYIAIIIGCLQIQMGMGRQIWVSVKNSTTPIDQVHVVLYDDLKNNLLAKGKTGASGMAFITFNDTIAGNDFRIELNKEGFSDKIIHRQSSDPVIAIETELSQRSGGLHLYIIGMIVLICIISGILFKIYRMRKISGSSR